MSEIIATTKNKKYKYIKSLKQKKIRDADGVFTVEGKKSVEDAIASGYTIRLVAMSESFSEEFQCAADTIVVRNDLFSGLCDTKTPQGIIAVIEKKETAFTPDTGKLYIYCDTVADPGNLGTIIRTADAAGFGGVLLSCGCADAYSPKTVRSSMGSFFNIDIITDFDYNSLFALEEKGFNLVCGALEDDSTDYTQTDFTKPTIIIVGNEANGVSEDILKKCGHIIIPIYGKAESLNVGVAAAIMMYEAQRQRRLNNE
ncbi:MAG: RNA methyltransferase [Clostridia bacterium]|nr:RNA methyltransferase [Clostridia bacterium]MBQ3124868.1 RNA methyltransferase [Clostridia bacterium]